MVSCIRRDFYVCWDKLAGNQEGIRVQGFDNPSVSVEIIGTKHLTLLFLSLVA